VKATRRRIDPLHRTSAGTAGAVNHIGAVLADNVIQFADLPSNSIFHILCDDFPR